MGKKKRQTQGKEGDRYSADVSGSGAIAQSGGVAAGAGGTAVGTVHGDLVVVSSLQELDQVDKATRRQLRQQYEAQVQRAPQSAGYQLALGLYYLDAGMYPQAVRALSAAHDRAPMAADILYYLSLARIAGRRLRTLPRSDVTEIETLLGGAIQNDPSRAHYYYLWALLKYDYYLGNGFRLRPPDIEDLLEEAELADYEPGEIRQMLRHAPAPRNPVTDFITSG